MIHITIKRGFFLAVLLLILGSLSVSAFTITTTKVDNTVLPGEQALFDVTITNTGSFEETYRLYISDLSWDVQTDPLSDFFGGLKIKAGESKVTRLLVQPDLNKAYGPYKVTLSVRSQKAEVIETQDLTINIVSPAPNIRDYLAAVSRIVSIPAEIDPREEVDIRINLRNRNPKNITALIIQLRSNLINEKVTTTLNPLETKTVSIPIKLDPLTQPQEDVLRVTLIVDGETLQPEIEEKFKVVDYSDIKTQSDETKGGFLSTTRTITYFNDGNLESTKEVQIGTNFFKRFFTSARPGYFAISRDNKQFLAWQLTIPPQESATITVTERYLSIFIVLVTGTVAYLLYYFLRSPVIVRKEAAVIGLREGGISELRVLLHIKNRSKKPYERLTIADRIPKIAEMEKELEVGTIKPTKVYQHGKQGTVIKWEIDNLEKFEERVLSYRLKSKLSILGGFNLPATLLKFKGENNKERVTKSNHVRLEV